MTRPLLDNIELQQVQEMETEQDQVLVQHSVPALEGDFLQRLDRRATQVTLIGVLTGPEIADGLKTLRQKFRAAQPVPFVADITTATKVDQVLIEEMGVRELAGKPERFEYAFTLREFIAPPAEETEEPPIPPEEPPDPEVATLEVEVIVEGDPNFDFSTTTVTVEGTQEDGTDLSRTLTNREDNIWTETDFPPGQYTARAVVSEPSMAGTADAVVRAGQTTRVTITLRRGQVTNIAKAFIVHFRFDKAFVEPCMRHVLKQVADYASAHSDEKLVIVGHTDKVGSDAYNQSLSERRARSVYAYLTIARDRVTALAEWDQLHRPRPSGTQLSINDSWGVREYQHILQDLVYYSGNVDGDDGPLTDSAVRTFQGDKGLTVDGIVGDQTWAALIDTYLSQDALAVPESQFLPNAKDGCDGGILKWLGCGEQDPVRNTQDAWRPNRRTELLFVSADALPCEVPQPDTFDLPSPRAVNNTWCLGPGDPNQRCCFVTRDTEQPGKWLVQPAEPGTITVRGRITFDDGTPVANARYVLIAPDGEFMDGETPAGSHRGEGIPGRTGVDGAFEYPDKPKDIGTYTLDIQGPFVARLEGEPSEAARGNVVCKRLDGSSDFNVIVCTPAVTFDLQVTDAVQIGGSASRTFLATRALSGDVIVTAVFPSGMCTAPRSITWTGGEEVPGNPLQRRVPRATVAQTTVTAMMPSTGMSKSVTIMVITVQLEAVKFNHDPTAATTDALNIRKNSTQTVAVPEWQRNISVNPIDSPVAYAINETRGNIITIQAKFQLAFPVTLTTEIRAVPQTPHVLGEVQGKQVTFLPTGETNFETFELQNVQIWDNSVGVGNHDITWMWQFRLQPANPWTDFVTSQHRIYAVLEVPKLPWQQMPFDSSNTQLPWTDVLEYACGWASGAINLDDAATKVTTEVYNLGTSILEYDCPGGGGTHYAFPDFNCTAFLERLGGGAGAGRYVNCSDCATIVSTFANILGCDLWQSRMGNTFDLNPILAIGSSTWQTACGWGGFSYHEVAWKGACTSSEEVFDACLQVDGDADPTAPPHTPLQPTNLRFGNIGDGQYRDRLAADTPTGRSNCRPQPSTRMRRRIV